MPSHYNDTDDTRKPTRKPKAPPRAIRGDAPTRGPNPDEMDDLEEKERIRKFFERLTAGDKSKLTKFVQELDEKVDARVEELKEESPRDLETFAQELDDRVKNLQKKTKNKQAYGGLMKAKKMRGGGMAGKKPRVGNMDYRKGGMVYRTKVKKG